MSRSILYYDDAGDQLADDIMYVRNYRGVGIGDSLFSTLHDGTKTAMDQVLNNTSTIPGYRVESYDCDFDYTDDEYSDENSLLDAWNTWLNDNGYTGRGSHMITHDHSPGHPGASAGGSPWTELSYGHATKRSSASAQTNTLLHELGHQFVRHSEVKDMTNGDEHDLGKNFEYYDGQLPYLALSPLGNSCGTNDGDCSRQCDGGCDDPPTICKDTWTEELTSCTVTGYERTHDYYW